ncbi:MAG TPA: LysM peptidoglycan-binding domain-containing protein, partial [Promineifilum sp.]
MPIRRLFLPVLASFFGLTLLVLPHHLMAQTAEPTLTAPASQPTPTLAATPTGSASDPAQSPIPRVHVVQDGENMTLIAANFGVSVEDILAINNLANGDLLQVGQELIIPGGSGDTIATAFTVGLGDTLAGLAAGFNTTIDAIVASNRLISADPPLRIGQSIPLISRTGSATIRPVTGRPYLVRPGDTLLLVAASHGLTPAQLAAENGLNTPAYLYPGQRLKIPDETTPYRFLPEGWVDIRLNSSAVTQGSTLVIYAQNMLAGTPAG